MASVFGHAISAMAIGSLFRNRTQKLKFFFLGILCSIFPDADVIGFSFGIDYGSFWGHRGFTHSILFGVLFGIFVTSIFYSTYLKSRKGFFLASYFSLCTISHGILDAMTTGGRGIAFFSPFDNERYFLPWRMIKVSPIGIENFFGKWGIQVLQSEMIYIGIPSLVVMVIWYLFYRQKK